MHNNNSEFSLRNAQKDDQKTIWKILQQAIERRKKDGSKQWQDGYPNEETIQNDIANNYGFVLEMNKEIVAYAAIIFDLEPAYEAIEGKWLTDGNYIVIHRVAISKEFAGQGIATKFFKKIEEFSISKNVFSIKVDTNFDNIPMLKILEKLGYKYCGEVYFRGDSRKAFEKILK